jgi:hypothetical protein
VRFAQKIPEEVNVEPVQLEDLYDYEYLNNRDN